jgi:cyclohexanone monooxygenase
VDFKGKRVACIGTGGLREDEVRVSRSAQFVFCKPTGSSAIQTIPVVAAQDITSLTVFQRTPAYSVPAQNAKLTPEQVESQKAEFEEIKRLGQIQGFGAGTFPMSGRPFSEFPDMEDRERIMEKGWSEGGPGGFA